MTQGLERGGIAELCSALAVARDTVPLTHPLTHSPPTHTLTHSLTHSLPYSQDSLDEAVHSLHEQIKAGALTLDRGRFPRAALQLLRDHGVADPHQPGTYICVCICICV